MGLVENLGVLHHQTRSGFHSPCIVLTVAKKMKQLVALLISLSVLISCVEENEEDHTRVPTGKGKIYGELNEREVMCGLRTIEKGKDSYACVYDHPHSDIDDRVIVGQSWMCPQEIYCDKR